MSEDLNIAFDWTAAKARAERALHAIEHGFEPDRAQVAKILRDRAKTLSERGGVERTKAPGVSVLGFGLGSGRYALPLETIAAIDSFERANGVPDMPDAVLGLLSSRGTVWGVYDLSRLLGEGGGEKCDGGYVLYLRKLRRHTALRVDRLDGIDVIEKKNIRSVPGDIRDGARFVSGIADNGARIIDWGRLRAHPLLLEEQTS